MIDVSVNTDDETFNAMKNFIIALIDCFDIGDQNVQVAILAFDQIRQTIIHLNDFSDRHSLKQAVRDISKGTSPFTNTGINHYVIKSHFIIH